MESRNRKWILLWKVQSSESRTPPSLPTGYTQFDLKQHRPTSASASTSTLLPPYFGLQTSRSVAISFVSSGWSKAFKDDVATNTMIRASCHIRSSSQLLHFIHCPPPLRAQDESSPCVNKSPRVRGMGSYWKNGRVLPGWAGFVVRSKIRKGKAVEISVHVTMLVCPVRSILKIFGLAVLSSTDASRLPDDSLTVHDDAIYCSHKITAYVCAKKCLWSGEGL